MNKLALKKTQQLVNRLAPLLITGLLFSQINVNTQRMSNIQDALFMERKGALEKAKIIYEKLLEQNPKNRQAYQRLKDIFKRTEELFKATELINSWIKSHPNDLQAHIELGEILYLNNDKINANKVWELFSFRAGKNSKGL